ncbi:MAG: CYTH and CHAD domain-containing protein [Mycolicibacterium sp.]|nr:CYTH and CHAD domain-containing protein [Mycolicibacterium sp.]
MAKKSKEVERKYDVADATVSPSFEGLASVLRIEQLPAQQLDAVYYDTADHRLAAHRITLRRRTGGDDAGWHLKLPAGTDARTEIHAPLADTVPEELRDVVLAIVRDTELVPVARIRNERFAQRLYGADEAVLAEFCDDHVHSTAGDDEQRWREWELELVADPEDRELLERLGHRLLDAGATPSRSAAKLARVLGDPPASSPVPADPIHRAVAEHVDELIVWDRAVRADEWDSVHQMRVTTRKLRSLLKDSEASFGLTDDAWVLDELRVLAAILGVARDAEVLAEKYEHALDELEPGLIRGPVRERLVDGSRRRYEAGWRRSLAAMRTPRYFRLLDALDELATAAPVPVEQHGEQPGNLSGAYARLRKSVRTAKAAEKSHDPHRDEALHRIRKTAKRLRYTAAAVGRRRVTDAAKTIQTLLGDHQDATVSRTHLAHQAEVAHAAGEDTFTYGLLYQREDDLAHRCRAELDDALAKLKRAMK